MTKGWKRFGYGCLICVFALLSLATVLHFTGASTFDAELHAWREIGGKERYHELAPLDVEIEKNAAAIWETIAAERILASWERNPLEELAPDNVEKLQEIVAKHSDKLSLAAEAAMRDECVWSTNYTSEEVALKSSPLGRTDLARLMIAQAYLASQRGNDTESFDWLLRTAVFSGHCAHEPVDGFAICDYIDELAVAAYQVIYRHKESPSPKFVEIMLDRNYRQMCVEAVLADGCGELRTCFEIG